MINITINSAGLQDIKELISWRMEVLREVFSLPTDTDMSALRKENTDYYIHSLHCGSHIACFAITDNNEKVGCGGICLQKEMPSPENQNGLCGYLMNIYVRPKYRHSGIGEKIVSWLVEEARKQDVTKIYLESSEPGLPLYKKLGFEKMKNYMKL